MKLRDSFNGDAPFEGDRALRWRSIPANARIVSATAIVTPVKAGLPEPFTELLSFNGGAVNFGATKATASISALATAWVEVDFHSPRTLARATGTFNETTLQVDVGGGVYVEINRVGGFMTPSDPAPAPFRLSGSSVPLPALKVTKIKLTNSNATPPELTGVTIRSVPTNVSLRVGELSPFWTHLGEMTQAETTPDFAAVLQAALATAEVKNGFYDLPLVIHTDSIARLKIELRIDVLTQQDALPSGLKEVVLPFDFSTLPQSSAAVLNVAVPPNSRVVPTETTARVKGTFTETRISYGPTGTVNPVASVEVSPACSQAQMLALDKPGDKDILATAVDLFIEPVTSAVRLRLDIRGDLDGKPADSSLLAAPVELTLDQQAAKGARWTSVPLPAEFLFMKAEEDRLKPQERKPRYWVVLQSLLGTAAWSVDKTALIAQVDTAAPLNMQCTRDGGLSWRDTMAIAGSLKDSNYPAAGPYTALLRLRRLPAQFKVPIELQVGSGQKEVRVKLDRFQPLGRVDFAINTELAQGINKYLKDTASAASPETEHLVNPKFEQWQKIGDALTARPTIPFGSVPINAVAFAPDGVLAYVLDLLVFKGGYLLVIDVACNKEIKEKKIKLDLQDPKAFVISPDGTRAYVTDGRKLQIVNLITHQAVGGSFDLIPPPSPGITATEQPARDMALSPDGQRLYLAKLSIATTRENRIWVIDTAKSEQQLMNGLPQTGAQTVKVVPTILEQQQSPAALAVSPNGSLLYMITDRGTSANALVEIFDTNSFAAASPPITVGRAATSIALSPDGTRAVVTNMTDSSVSVIDTKSRTMNLISVGQAPVDVAISPEGTRAYALNQISRSISIIDLSQQTVIKNFALEPGTGFPPLALALALAPQGEQIYVVNSGVNTLSSIQFGTRLPAGWQHTSGTVIPYCLPQPFHLTPILGSETLPTGLSQVVPVAESSTYEFSFWGLAAEPQGDEPPAIGEVLWLNNACGQIQPNPPVPIKLAEDQEDLRAIANQGNAPPSAIGATERKVPLVLHRARMNSPAGATQAEVRFSVPKGGVAAIDLVSLAATSELTANADFKLQKDGLLSDWTLSPKVAPGFVLVSAEDGIQLNNAGAATAELVQRIAAKGGEPFTLEFQGKAAPAASPTQTNQSLELRWLKADGTSTGEPTIVEILSGGFDSSVASGTVPTDATQAEIHLIIPARTSLKVKRVSLRYSTSTIVPLTFIAEAPGELTVADVRIAFEQVEPTPPTVPEQGLCIPTPPGRQPGQTGGGSCFCHQCESEQTMIDAKPTVTMGDRPAVVGRCATCKEEMVLLGGPPADAQAQPLFDAPIITRSTAVANLPAETMTHTANMATMESVAPATDNAAMITGETPSAEIADAAKADEAKEDASANEITRIPLSVLVKARIKGIGEARSQQLAQIGINSLEELAAAKPDHVSQIKGISVTMATALINQANVIVATERGDKDSA